MYNLLHFVIRFLKTEKLLFTINNYRDNNCSSKMCNFLLKIFIKTLQLNFYDITYVNFYLFLTLKENFENIYSPSNEHI